MNTNIKPTISVLNAICFSQGKNRVPKLVFFSTDNEKYSKDCKSDPKKETARANLNTHYHHHLLRDKPEPIIVGGAVKVREYIWIKTPTTKKGNSKTDSLVSSVNATRGKESGYWRPKKKIDRAEMEKIRLLNQELPQKFTVAILSEQFKVSREAIKRILKSKYIPQKDT